MRASSHIRGGGGGGRGGRKEDGEEGSRVAHRSSGVVEGPPCLPERLVERLKSSSWVERLEAVEDLEKFVDAYPKALEPHLHKVHHM